jgi:hypothetical protein
LSGRVGLSWHTLGTTGFSREALGRIWVADLPRNQPLRHISFINDLLDANETT